MDLQLQDYNKNVFNKKKQDEFQKLQNEIVKKDDFVNIETSQEFTDVVTSSVRPDFSAKIGFSLPYTIPTDGFILVGANDSNSTSLLYVDGVTVFRNYTVQNNRFAGSSPIPVSKGEVVTGSGNFDILDFWPCKGVK